MAADFNRVLRETALDDPAFPDLFLSLYDFNEEEQVQMLEVVEGNESIKNVKITGRIQRSYVYTGYAGMSMSIRTTEALAGALLELPNVNNVTFESIKFEDFTAVARTIEALKDRRPIGLEFDYIDYTAGRLEENLQRLLRSNALEFLKLGAGRGRSEGRRVDLSGALQSNRSIKRFVHTCSFSPRTVQGLPRMLKVNTFIEEIDLQCLKLSTVMLRNICRAVEGHESLTKLMLPHEEEVQEDEGEAIALARTKPVATMLAKTPGLKYLHLSGRGWDIFRLCAVLNACRLESLHLVRCGIGDEECQALGGVLERNEKLKEVDLEDNWIGNDGAFALARAFSRNTTIQDIGVARNRIGSEGVSSIAGALLSNHSVKKINMVGNPIYDEGVNSVFEMLTTNDSIEFVGLRIVGEQALNALIAFLPRMSTLEKFHLDGLAYLMRTAEDAFIQALIQALEQNTVLVQLENTWYEFPPAVEALLTRNRALLPRNRARRVLMRWPQDARSLWPILGESPQDADVLYFSLRGNLLDTLFPRSGERDVAIPSSDESRDVVVPDMTYPAWKLYLLGTALCTVGTALTMFSSQGFEKPAPCCLFFASLPKMQMFFILLPVVSYWTFCSFALVYGTLRLRALNLGAWDIDDLD